MISEHWEPLQPGHSIQHEGIDANDWIGVLGYLTASSDYRLGAVLLSVLPDSLLSSFAHIAIIMCISHHSFFFIWWRPVQARIAKKAVSYRGK